ncbi:MAG: RNA polymerase sigma-70 factor [Bacteroidetes bacterium]|nr:RNA polymerase sigma-70 factor [Bacteroidota bacterium]
MFGDKTDYTVILQRLKAGDQEAFEALYLHARERLYVYAFAILKDEAAAQDIVQELFADFWEDRLFQEIHTSLSAYLVRTVRNRSLDYIKREQGRVRIRRELLLNEGLAADVAGAWALGEEIEAAIGKLPPMAAKVFRLHYIEKLSHTEIAAQLHISSHTVSNHITKALKVLRENLKNI